MIDHDLVRKLRVQVAERLNEQRRRDQVNGVPPMSAEDEREYARSLIVQVLEDHARYEIADGRTPPTPDDEAQIAGAIHSALFGVGRLQPLLDDPEVENIDINGCDQVFVQYGDGREEMLASGRRDRRGAGRADPGAGRPRRPDQPAVRLRQPAARPAAARRLPAVGGHGCHVASRGVHPARATGPGVPSRPGRPTARCPTTSARSCGPRSRRGRTS